MPFPLFCSAPAGYSTWERPRRDRVGSFLGRRWDHTLGGRGTSSPDRLRCGTPTRRWIAYLPWAAERGPQPNRTSACPRGAGDATRQLLPLLFRLLLLLLLLLILLLLSTSSLLLLLLPLLLLLLLIGLPHLLLLRFVLLLLLPVLLLLLLLLRLRHRRRRLDGGGAVRGQVRPRRR